MCIYGDVVDLEREIEVSDLEWVYLPRSWPGTAWSWLRDGRSLYPLHMRLAVLDFKHSRWCDYVARENCSY